MPAELCHSRHVSEQDALMTARRRILKERNFCSKVLNQWKLFGYRFQSLEGCRRERETLFNLFRHRFNSIPGERFVCYHFAYLLLNLLRDDFFVVSAWILFHFFCLVAIISNYFGDLWELHFSTLKTKSREKGTSLLIQKFWRISNPLESCWMLNFDANRLWLLKNIS